MAPTTPHATKQHFREAFGGLVFPVSKAGLVNKALDRGGIDREVRSILGALPERRYGSLEDLQEAVRAIYLAHGVGADDLPL